jgi:hypothetical protein
MAITSYYHQLTNILFVHIQLHLTVTQKLLPRRPKYKIVALLLLLLVYLIMGFLVPGTSPIEPVVNPTTQASSLRLYHFPYDV